jgi:hypothetical protein
MEAARAVEIKPDYPGKGNPDFVLSKEAEQEAMESFDFDQLAAQAEESNVLRGTPATEIPLDDREIEAMLERQAKQTPIDDLGADQPLKVEKQKRDTLRNHVENYQSAKSLIELEEQVHQAKMLEIDSIEATPALVRHFCKREYDFIRENVGYFIYKDIRVYIDGLFEQNKNADKLTMEQKMHGHGSKGDIVPMITPQKV